MRVWQTPWALCLTGLGSTARCLAEAWQRLAKFWRCRGQHDAEGPEQVHEHACHAVERHRWSCGNPDSRVRGGKGRNVARPGRVDEDEIKGCPG